MEYPYKEKVVLITGASRGLGRYLCVYFAEKGAKVAATARDRQKLDEVNFQRVDPTECIKSLKGLVAGPLSRVAPVQPILQLDREDRRFVESQAVLAEINATTNLAEIGWEEFEHLVRELFGKMFSEQGADVKRDSVGRRITGRSL